MVVYISSNSSSRVVSGYEIRSTNKRNPILLAYGHAVLYLQWPDELQLSPDPFTAPSLQPLFWITNRNGHDNDPVKRTMRPQTIINRADAMIALRM